MKLIFGNDSMSVRGGNVARKLSSSVVPVEQLIHGAVRCLVEEDGSITPSRFSAEQAEVLAQLGREEQARATAGIRIEFTTTGTAFSFDLVVTNGLDETDRNFAVGRAFAVVQPQKNVARIFEMLGVDKDLCSNTDGETSC